MSKLKYVAFLLMFFICIGVRGQYNPENPAEPGRYYPLLLKASPSHAGSVNITSGTKYLEGKAVSLQAYTNSGFKFVHWEENGVVISRSAYFTYTMPARQATLVAHYEYAPSNPGEPSKPVLPEYSKIYLDATPTAGGYFNISSGNSYQVGNLVYLRAYNNSDFVFQKWTDANGEVVSTSSGFNYEVKEGDDNLTAHFIYAPGNPSEPSVAKLNRRLVLTPSIPDAGYFNIASGNKYLEGSSVWLQAYTNTDFMFEKWMEGDSVLSTDAGFYYQIPERNVELLAVYSYDSTKLIPLGGELQIEGGEYVYTGEAICPAVTFVNNGDTALILGKDYNIEYKNNVEPGIATVSAKGVIPYFGEVKTTFEIQKMDVDTSLLAIFYPDSLTYYDGKTHELAVRPAAGMGKCTVYYTDSKGNWSSNMPIEPDVYSVTLVFDEGEYYKGTTIEDFYSFEIKLPPQLSQEEWDILVSIYETLDGTSWNTSWDMSVGIGNASSLYGVTIEVGHVISIDLSDNGLSGTFPFQLFDLSYLTSLNLAGNALTGNLSEGLKSHWASTGQEAVETLVNLDISRNQLEGNIGEFASAFPNLTSLAVQENNLSEVSPMLPTDIQVMLYPQRIQTSEEMNLSWNEISEELLLEQLPGMATYDHANQCYKVPSLLYCQDAETMGAKWSAEFALVDGKPCWSHAGGVVTEPYMLSNGAPMLCQDAETGNSFELSFLYEEGDANFSGSVDVLDLQRIINYAFDPYTYETSFNYTMANLYLDDKINVQDVVLMVSLLLNQPVSVAVPLSLTYTDNSDGDIEAELEWNGAELTLNTEVAVASFEVLLAGCVADKMVWQLPEGFTVQCKEMDGFTRVVVYSLSGVELPVGESVLATMGGQKARLVSVTMADSNARKIATRLDSRVTGIEWVEGNSACTCRWMDDCLQLNVHQPLERAEWKLMAVSEQTVAEGYLDRIEVGRTILPLSIVPASGVYVFHLQSAHGMNVVEKIFVK